VENALQFDGVNDYVDLPESPSLTTGFTSGITLEAWISSDNFQSASVIASGNQNDYAVATLAGGKLRVDMYGIDAAIGAFISKKSLTTNTWYHIAVTYDGSTETILIDGIVDTARPATGALGTSPQPEDFRIGSYSGSSPNFFRGMIDEVRIWNLARSQKEILQKMNDTLAGSESGLVGYWRFDEGSGVIAHDLTANGNNGTLVNGPAWIRIVDEVSGGTGSVPEIFSLGQNYPNPFNPGTSIPFTLRSESFVTLTIYDILGRPVSALLAARLPAGAYSAKFDAERLASGTYFYRLQAGSFTETKRLMILK
jgi:hypothetical protein